MKINRTRAVVITIAAAASAAAAAAIALASAGSGTSVTILAPRSTFSDTIHLNDDRIKFQTKDPTDLVTQQVTFAPHAFSGWHHHPGFILVLVKSGHVTTHDANCQTKTYGPGQAFVESGSAPFEVTNDSDTETAVDVATQVAPAGSPFRIEDDPPPCASS
jgi:quercetin dioxygenase-like cupin family protein